MMQFFKNLFSRFSDDDDDDFHPAAPPPGVGVRPGIAAQKPFAKTAVPELRAEDEVYTSDIGGRIADGGPGKNVLVRSKYVREDTGTHETLKIVDDSIFLSEEELGADPYNTGRFDRSKSWDASRFRK